MAYTYAGQFSRDMLLTGPDDSVLFAPGLAVSVFVHGSGTLATLWSDRAKSMPLANPVAADESGNLAFYADPGLYDLSANGGTVTVSVVPAAVDIARSGPEFDYRDFAIRLGDDDYDSGPGINLLVAQARDAGGIGVLGPGDYYAGETLVLNSSVDQGAVALMAKAALGSFLGNKPVRIRRPVGLTHTMATATGRGLLIEGMTFDGQGTAGDGLVVSRGFEFAIRRSRFVDIAGTAMDLRALSNGELARVFVDRCGTPSSGTGKTAVRIRGNSAVEYVSNTVRIDDMHIERSSGTALDLAYGNAVDDLIDFLRVTGLHVEQAIDNTTLPDYVADPVVRLGNIRGGWFFGTVIYGGLGTLLTYDKLADNGGSAARGVKFFGGRLLGHLTSHAVDVGTPDRLVDLVHGDNIEFHGVEFDTADVELVRIRSTFGKEAFFPGCEFMTTRGTATKVTDDRADDTTHRGQMAMPGILADGADSRFRSEAAGRIVSIDTAAGQAATLRFESAGVGRIDIRKSSASEAGSNAGSDLEFVRRADDGTNLGVALTITRSSGLVTAAAGLTVVGTTTLAATAISGGDLTLSAASGARIVAIQRVAGQVGRLALRTGTSDRWHINVNATAEGGSDAGSDLEIASRTDAGATKTTVITITRSNGRTAFGGDVQLNDKNLIFGTTTGTQIGTASTQKLGFYGATPIVRPTLPSSGTVTAADIRTMLINVGLAA